MSTPKLFQPAKIGTLALGHRILLAPLTRYKSSKKEHVPSLPLMKEYYTQRGSAPGTLLISEGTFIAAKAGGYDHVPGIWSQEQIDAWKVITDSVHAAGSFMFMQLWALGRAANTDILASEAHPYVSASDIALSGKPTPPRPLSVDEIHEYAQLYATAAENAVRAGFDGVEIHGANGYLVDQFIQDSSNKRTDAYGGSVENRAKFALEVIQAVSKAVGAEKTAIRFSPWSTFQDMRMKDPIPTFSYLVAAIKSRFPDLAYIHIVEPRISGAQTADESDSAEESNDFIRELWAPRPLVSAGGYTREDAIKTSEAKGDFIAMGRYFISNPDIVERLRKDIPLHEYDRDTFYLAGDLSGRGYTDQPFAEQAK